MAENIIKSVLGSLKQAVQKPLEGIGGFAVETADDLLKTGKDAKEALFDWNKTFSKAEELLNQSKQDEAAILSEKLLKQSEVFWHKNEEQYGKALILCCRCNEADDKLKARKYALEAMQYESVKPQAMTIFKQLNSDLTGENFLSIVPKGKRQFLMVVDSFDEIASSYSAMNTKIDLIFEKTNIPVGLQFSTGIAQPYVLYMAHPIYENRFIKLEDANRELVIEKSRALLRIFKSLGAKTITVSSVNKSATTNLQSMLHDIKAGIEDLGEKLSINTKTEDKDEKYEIYQTKAEIIGSNFKPTSISLPNDLLPWVEQDPEIQHHVATRQDENGGDGYGIEYTLHSSIIVGHDHNYLMNVAASYSELTTNINSSYSYSLNESMKHWEDLVFKLKVQFASHQEIAENLKDAKPGFFKRLFKK
jgi:hypothetical protein